MSSITVYKLNHHGEIVTQYPGDVVERGESWLCLHARFQPAIANLGFVTFDQGDLFIEWFYADRWYNIFEVHAGADSHLKGWYCNVTRPAVITADSVKADDLEVDIFVRPDGTMMLLDEEEFSKLNLSTEERMQALRAIQAIRKRVTERDAPFDKIR